MGMMLAAGGASGKRRRRRAPVMSEINVTPMVDVMLVLLIIFMVAAPLMTTSIDIDLPIARGGAAAPSNAPPLTLSIKRAQGNCSSNVDVYLGDTQLPVSELDAKLRAIQGTRSESERLIFVRGDRDVCYTDIMRVLGVVRVAGFKASVVIIPEQGS